MILFFYIIITTANKVNILYYSILIYKGYNTYSVITFIN